MKLENWIFIALFVGEMVGLVVSLRILIGWALAIPCLVGMGILVDKETREKARLEV